MKKKYYSFKNGILQYNFDYNFIVGGRSNGKTTSYQRDVALANYLKDKEQFVKVVRTTDDTVALLNEKWIDVTVQEKLNELGLVYCYYKKAYYIGNKEDYDDYGTKRFCEKYADLWGYVIPLSQQGRYKSSDRSKVTSIVFDEFAVDNQYLYLPKEVESMMSLISTIIRSRDNVKVFFIGNALSIKNPYFDYFGIDASKLKSGNVYTFTQKGTEFNEYASVGLDFVEMVYSEESDIPKLLRVSGNAQATTLDRYSLPSNIIKRTDWLYRAIKNNMFNEYYYIKNIIAWCKDDNVEDENDIKFDRHPTFICVLEIVFKYDNNVRYFVKNNIADDYGLTLNIECKKPNVMVGKDIRLKLPLFKLDIPKSNYILGTTDLIDMLEEMDYV